MNGAYASKLGCCSLRWLPRVGCLCLEARSVQSHGGCLAWVLSASKLGWCSRGAAASCGEWMPRVGALCLEARLVQSQGCCLVWEASGRLRAATPPNTAL